MSDDMTAETTGAPEDGTNREAGPEEDEALEVVEMRAPTSAIGSVCADDLDATQCAIGSATVEGDAAIDASLVGVLSAESVGVHQGGAAVMVVDGDVSIDQGGAQVIVAQTVGIEQGGVGVLVTGEASLARSWVGVMAARNATLSDDSRVVIDTRSALIIGGLLFGGLGLVGLCIALAGRRIASRIPRLPGTAHHRHPSATPRDRMAAVIRARMREMEAAGHGPAARMMPDLSKLDLPSIVEMIAKLRHAG